jgi:NhaA family Na+:H+ antiporter
VVPLFAFANAGIPIVDGFADALSSPVTWGVILGLIVGKPLGITFLSWLAVRSGIARLPSGIDWRDVFGVAWLGGIGFTMSLFITELAFAGEETADAARIGVLIGSLVAGVVGYFILRSALPSQIDIDEEIEAEAA